RRADVGVRGRGRGLVGGRLGRINGSSALAAGEHRDEQGGNRGVPKADPGESFHVILRWRTRAVEEAFRGRVGAVRWSFHRQHAVHRPHPRTRTLDAKKELSPRLVVTRYGSRRTRKPWLSYTGLFPELPAGRRSRWKSRYFA